MPIVAMVAIDLLDMAVLRLTLAPIPASLPGGAGARPDHSISGSSPVKRTDAAISDGAVRRWLSARECTAPAASAQSRKLEI